MNVCVCVDIRNVFLSSLGLSRSLSVSLGLSLGRSMEAPQLYTLNCAISPPDTMSPFLSLVETNEQRDCICSSMNLWRSAFIQSIFDIDS
jgi:hypothetical protein